MTKEFLSPGDKKRLEELYIGYHSPWNEAHEQAIFKREIEFLVDGISNSLNPYHFFALSTLNHKKVTSRTVVLRNIDKNPLAIYFNADYRSPKVKQLLSNKQCFVLFYDNKRKIQIRIECKAIVNYNNTISKRIWNSSIW